MPRLGLYSIFSAVALLMIAPCTTAAPPAPSTEVVATYSSGTVTVADTVAILQGEGESRDPYTDILTTSDEAQREEAAFWLDRAIRDVVWARHWSAIARDAGTTVPADASQMADKLRGELALSTWIRNQPAPPAPGIEMETQQAAKIASEMSHPANRNVSYIFRQIDPNSSEQVAREAFDQLSELRTKIVAGQIPFTEAARRTSDAPSAARGGSIGPVTRDSGFNAPFMDLIFSTAAGEVSPVTKLRNGFYLVKIDSDTPEVKLSAEDVLSSPSLKARVNEAAKATIQMQMLAELQKRHKADSPEAAALADLKTSATVMAGIDQGAELVLQRGRAMAFHHARREDSLTSATEKEIEDYYEQMKAGYVEEGLFKLTRFVVPVRNGSVSNQLEAQKIANQALELLKNGATPEQVREKLPSQAFVWEPNDKWLQSSTVGPADMELLKIKIGDYSTVHETKEGAVFFHLNDRRTPPTIPLEKVRNDITRKLTSAKRRQKMFDDHDTLLKALDLKMVWREKNNYPTTSTQ